jgi:hypothetical protein
MTAGIFRVDLKIYFTTKRRESNDFSGHLNHRQNRGSVMNLGRELAPCILFKKKIMYYVKRGPGNWFPGGV